MRRSLVLASCALLPTGDGDEVHLPDLLDARGVTARWAPWGGAHGPDETSVLRATWDYTDDPGRFLAWCATAPRLVNPLPAITANLDKRYLVRLAAQGVETIPTTLVEPRGRFEPPDDEFVIKPAVGAGARLVERFRAGDVTSARRQVRSIHERGMAALVQPYQEAVDRTGETALVFLGGRYSHAFHKGPLLTGRRILVANGAYMPEELGPAEPDQAQRSLAEQALEASAADAGVALTDLAYARVDVVSGETGPRVLEVELIEPSLGFTFTDAAALDRFADVLATMA